MLCRSAARGAGSLVREATPLLQSLRLLHPSFTSFHQHHATAKLRDPTEAELEEARACLQLLMRASDRAPGAIRVAAAEMQLDAVKDLIDSAGAEDFAPDSAETTPMASSASASTAAQRLSTRQTATVALAAGVPAIGFGFLDNFIMISAGSEIDSFFGVAFGFSTMAAAGLGNLVSDVAGTGFEGVIERNFAVSQPKLTREQRKSKGYNRSRSWGKVLGIALGCLIGMFPLLIVLPRWAKARIDAGKRALGAEPNVDRALRLAAEAEARLAAEAAWSAPAALESDTASLLFVHRSGEHVGTSKSDAASLGGADNIARVPRFLVDPRLTAAGRRALPIASSSPSSVGEIRLADILEGVGGSKGGLVPVDDGAPLSRILSAAARSVVSVTSLTGHGVSSSLSFPAPGGSASVRSHGAQTAVTRANAWLDHESGMVILADPVRSGKEAAAVAAAVAAAGVRVCVPCVIPVRHTDAMAASSPGSLSFSPTDRSVSPSDVWLDSLLPAELDVLSQEEANGGAKAVAELARGVLVFHPVGPGGGSFGGSSRDRHAGGGRRPIADSVADDESKTAIDASNPISGSTRAHHTHTYAHAGSGGGMTGFRDGDSAGVCAVLVSASWSADLVASSGDSDLEGNQPAAKTWNESISSWTLPPGQKRRRGASLAAGAIDVVLPSPALLHGTSSMASTDSGSSVSSQTQAVRPGMRDAVGRESGMDMWQLLSHAWTGIAGTADKPDGTTRDTVHVRVSATVMPPAEQVYKLEGEDDSAAHARRVTAARPALPSLRSSKTLWALGGVIGPAVTAINGAKVEAALDEAGLQAVLLCARHSLRGLAAALAATGSCD